MRKMTAQINQIYTLILNIFVKVKNNIGQD